MTSKDLNEEYKLTLLYNSFFEEYLRDANYCGAIVEICLQNFI